MSCYHTVVRSIQLGLRIRGESSLCLHHSSISSTSSLSFHLSLSLHYFILEIPSHGRSQEGDSLSSCFCFRVWLLRNLKIKEN